MPPCRRFDRSASRRAFTFAELMAALTTIAVLAVIAVPNFLEAQIRATVSRSKADLAILKMGIEAYRADCHAYPLNAAPGQAGPGDLTVLTTPVAYIGHLPYDVFTVAQLQSRRTAPPPKPGFYRYYNGVQVDPEAGIRVTPPGLAFSGGYIAAMVWGYGPMQSFPEIRNVKPVTGISPKGEATLLPYDPTNGTSSDGDIYQRLP